MPLRLQHLTPDKKKPVILHAVPMKDFQAANLKGWFFILQLKNGNFIFAEQKLPPKAAPKRRH